MSGQTLQVLRRAFPILLGAVLFAMGIYALLHLLRDVDSGAILAQIKSTPWGALWGAIGGTAMAYVALAFYDVYALRYIGKSLPGGVIGIGGFLGYAFGNTIGVSVVSGGAVRYRIYSAYGLNAFEVAAISGYIGLALGTGLTLVGLAALAIHPHAVLGYLPYGPGTVRVVAGGIFAVSVALIVWMSFADRRLTIMGYQLRMPPPRDLGGQVLVVLLDIASASFALWILLPAGKPDFATFVAIYSTAMMVGVLSHVPGGVGVFETVVIGTLPADVPVGDAAAALLLFRLIYYLVPFAIGFLIVALNEARVAGGWLGRLLSRLPAPMQPALSTLHGLVPSLTGLVAFGYGIYLLAITMIPSVRSEALAEGDLIGTLLREGGTLASAVAGVTLLIIAHGLARRVSSAYWLAIVTLIAGAVGALLDGGNWPSAIVLSFGVLVLLPLHNSFDRHGPLTQGVFGPRWFLMMSAVVCATAAFAYYVNRTVPYTTDLWVEFAPNSDTPRALRSGLAASAMLLFFCLFLALRPAQQKSGKAPHPMERAADILSTTQDPAGWLALTGDKQLLFSEQNDAFLMYAIYRGRWVAFGDPIGNPERFAALGAQFCDLSARANARPVLYGVSDAYLPIWTDLGFGMNRIGDEAIVHLPARSGVGQEVQGLTFDILHPPHDQSFDALKAVSDAWLEGASGQDKKFSVGRFAPDYLAHFDITVARRGGQIVAFANLLPAENGQTYGVDLLRYRPEEGPEIIGALLAYAMEHAQSVGAQRFSLGIAPLAGLSDKTVGRTWNQFGRLIYRHGGAFDSFEALRTFKHGFGPEWQPRYVALPPNVSPLVVMSDMASLVSGLPRRQRLRNTALS